VTQILVRGFQSGLVVILDGSLFYVTVPFSFLLVYGTSKKKVVFFPLKLKA
jgi:hypothetical protein